MKSAQLAMTADNEFTVWIDGRQVGSGDTHTRTFTFDVAASLKQGANLVAVEAVNATDDPSPAGLIGALTIHYKDGHKQTIVTDKTWESAEKAGEKWNSTADAGDGWTAAKELGRLGMAPWGNLDAAAAANNDLYPEVDLVTDVLKKMDVPPDFTYQTAKRHEVAALHPSQRGRHGHLLRRQQIAAARAGPLFLPRLRQAAGIVVARYGTDRAPGGLR